MLYVCGLFICSHSQQFCTVVSTSRTINYVLAVLIFKVAACLSGNLLWHINKVAVRRAGLVLRWVTVCRCTVLVLNQAIQTISS